MPNRTAPPNAAQLARIVRRFVVGYHGSLRGRPHRLVVSFDAEGGLAEVPQLILEPLPRAVPASFIPSPFQKAILKALEGKAMRTDTLASRVGDRRRLFRDPGGLPELKDHDLVRHHSRIGYYRPDAPPADLPAE